jgi:hypothetical protein
MLGREPASKHDNEARGKSTEPKSGARTISESNEEGKSWVRILWHNYISVALAKHFHFESYGILARHSERNNPGENWRIGFVCRYNEADAGLVRIRVTISKQILV